LFLIVKFVDLNNLVIKFIIDKSTIYYIDYNN